MFSPFLCVGGRHWLAHAWCQWVPRGVWPRTGRLTSDWAPDAGGCPCWHMGVTSRRRRRPCAAFCVLRVLRKLPRDAAAATEFGKIPAFLQMKPS